MELSTLAVYLVLRQMKSPRELSLLYYTSYKIHVELSAGASFSQQIQDPRGALHAGDGVLVSYLTCKDSQLNL